MAGAPGDGGVGVTGVCGVDDELDPQAPANATAAAISSNRPGSTVYYPPAASRSVAAKLKSHRSVELCSAVCDNSGPRSRNRQQPLARSADNAAERVHVDWRAFRNVIDAMGYTAGFLLLTMSVVLGLASSGQGQVPATLRAALLHYGFDAAIAAPDVRHVDALLTSSEFAASAGTFVAAYYLREELNGQAFGRLHVSLFDRTTGRWRHAPALRQQIGSVLGVRISERHILIEGHASPSAGVGLLLSRTTLRAVTRLGGYGLRFLPDGSILYRANMVHFAPVHQERLMVFDTRSRREAEIFPGKTESAIAATYRRTIMATYEKLSLAQKAAFEQSAYGAVDDYDRSISNLAEGPAGDRLAFVTSYESNRMDKRVPRAHTLVRCDRSSVLVWSCNERDLDEAARAFAFELRRQPNGWFEDADIDPLIRKVLGL